MTIICIWHIYNLCIWQSSYKYVYVIIVSSYSFSSLVKCIQEELKGDEKEGGREIKRWLKCLRRIRTIRESPLKAKREVAELQKTSRQLLRRTGVL